MENTMRFIIHFLKRILKWTISIGILAATVLVSSPVFAYDPGDEPNDVIYSALIGAMASVIAGLLASIMLRRRRKQLSHRKEKIRETMSKVGIDLGFVKADILSNELVLSQRQLDKIEEQIIARLSDRHDLNSPKLKATIENELEEFRDRIAKIEKRFPSEAQLEKIASINEAIFAVRIDQLANQIDALEGRILSRWDVAVTVSSIIGAIFAIIAATYAVIGFIAKH